MRVEETGLASLLHDFYFGKPTAAPRETQADALKPRRRRRKRVRKIRRNRNRST